jgi:hypothetical protein
MPSQRFLLVEGVDGHPVVDPHNPAANPARYIGWRLRSAPALDPDHVLEHYEPEQQVVLEHQDLRKAIAAGHLALRGQTVAKNHEAARAALLPAPSASTPEP